MTIANPSTFAFYNADQSDTPGFAANVMKANLDVQGNYLSSYIQTVLLPGLHSTAASTSGAAQIGSPAVVSGSTKYTVYGQLTDINTSVTSLSSSVTSLSSTPLANWSTASAHGSVVYRSSDAWEVLAPSTTAKFNLQSQGSGADPTWTASLQSVLTTQGDMIYASTANTPANLAVGTAGQSLLSDGTTPVWSDAGAYASMSRQAIIDGNFQIAQVGNGAAVTNPAALAYPVCDLWATYFNVDGGTPPTIIHSQAALTPGELDGSYYAYKIAVNGAGSGYGNSSFYQIHQYIEHGTRALCGLNKKVTVSFKAKSTIAGKKIGVFMSQQYGTGGSPSADEFIAGDNFTLTSDWQEFSHTFTTNTLSGKTFGTANNDLCVVQFALQWGATWGAARVNAASAESWVGSGDIYIAQVQFCAGDVALPFEPKSFADELRACQRYYWKSFPYATPVAQNSGVATGSISYVSTISGETYAGFRVSFPVPMRTTPVLTFYNPSAANAKFRNFWANRDSGTAYSERTSNQDMFIMNQQVAEDLVGPNIGVHATADARF